MTAHLYFRPEGYNSEQSYILGILTAALKFQKVTRKGRLGELTLKKSSWCTTQQLGNVFRSLFVKVVFPPLVTLERKELLNQKRLNYEKLKITLRRLQETYPPMPMINFILLLCVGHLWNSVNKRREPRQRKPSVKGLLWETFPSPPQQMFPPFTTSLIDNLSRAYKGFGRSVTPRNPVCPPVSSANGLQLYGGSGDTGRGEDI